MNNDEIIQLNKKLYSLWVSFLKKIGVREAHNLPSSSKLKFIPSDDPKLKNLPLIEEYNVASVEQISTAPYIIEISLSAEYKEPIVLAMMARDWIRNFDDFVTILQEHYIKNGYKLKVIRLDTKRDAVITRMQF